MNANGPEDVSQTQGFALRLRQALERRGKKTGATALEREFNLRYRGAPITSHAARKWLLGMSVPTLDKLQVLARWLDVSEDWLRWGADPEEEMTSRVETGMANPPHIAAQARGTFAQDLTSLQQDWRLLEPRNRAIIKSVIELLLRDQRKKSLDNGKEEPPATGAAPGK